MPTLKQEKAFKERLADNGRNMGEIIKSAGYSDAVAKAPTKLTKSKGWKYLMDKYFPEDDLAEKHKYLLDKKRKEEIQIKALDMGYKLRNKYPVANNINAIQINVGKDREEYT